ncbi:hypothetical protein ELQ35_01360 [Peribacillus cavernae]|uniref:Uncharacterized protein n=1 Tax=Peribacillus cavernae TaxID=1674310 RepID=A0A433HWQ6_9BACI|nr:hypothetical protein [Peribacillus cavernae]MDQ0218078.1 hypothetical protein [Peribacillus cavernae]RUQ32762.1 hypothetical protein ELQ35_01360 [Peribacillus cavernae]
MEEAQLILKDLGKKVGKVEVPVGVRVFEAVGPGLNTKIIEVEKKSISDIKQEFSLKSVEAGKPSAGEEFTGNASQGAVKTNEKLLLLSTDNIIQNKEEERS